MLFSRRKPATAAATAPELLSSSPVCIRDRWYVRQQYRDPVRGTFWVARRAGRDGDSYFNGRTFSASSTQAHVFPDPESLARAVENADIEAARAVLNAAAGQSPEEEPADDDTGDITEEGGGEQEDDGSQEDEQDDVELPDDDPALPAARGLRFRRHFTREDVSPHDEVEWSRRDVEIRDASGKVVFAQKGVEAPAFYSDQAVRVIASKYFHGDPDLGTDPSGGGRETSVRQLVSRVVDAITTEGDLGGCFATEQDRLTFHDELSYLCLHQYGAFNSPVWFNLGLDMAYGLRGQPGGFRWCHVDGMVVPCEDSYAWPRGSACYLQGVEDDMGSIMALAASEADLFKFGAGTGSDLSTLRASTEKLTGGGYASGPVSFLRIYDTIGAQIKSGGRVRRAARMNTLKDRHPDIRKFVTCKRDEDRKAKALIEAGWSDGMTGEPHEAYSSVAFQSTNLSVRLSDAFMEKAVGRSPYDDNDWPLKAVRTGETAGVDNARALLDLIAECAWECGDPGAQFHDTINRWHTTPAAGAVETSNPCSEVVYLNDISCNLASLNLLKFRRPDGAFDIDGFRHAVRVFLVAQEILVDLCSYPTAKIARNSHDYRPLGLGYANLGAYLMSSGIPYDSARGRHLAGAITALMHGQALLTSAELAENLGAFPGFAADREAMLKVVGMHEDACLALSPDMASEAFRVNCEAAGVFGNAVEAGRAHGYRNAQSTLIAPTGTIMFMMDCDTGGLEPAIALASTKSLSGGGQLHQAVRCVGDGLRSLGYEPRRVDQILAYVEREGTVEDVEALPDMARQSGLKAEHLPVFDCAYPSYPGTRHLSWRAHVDMVAAIQPFISGAASKCVTGDTVIQTGRGLLRIGGLHQGEAAESFRDIDLDVPSPGGTVKAKSFYYGGVRPVWKVTLADGRQIRGTRPHRLRIATPGGLGWKEMPEIEAGDFVALHRGAELWGYDAPPAVELSPAYGCQNTFRAPTESSFDLGLFLGMLTADGHVVASNYVVGITKNCDRVLDEFVRLLKSLFGLEARRIEDPRNGVKGVSVGSKSLVEWLHGVGFLKAQIPDFLLRSNRAALTGYLSGLYLDGYISKPGDLAISQKRRTLLNDVQAVWDNLGVATYFGVNVVNGVDYPVLHVMACHRYKAAAMLTWLEPHKAERAADLCDSRDKRPFPMHRARLEEQIRSAGRTQEFRSVLDPRTNFLGRSIFFDAAEKIGLELTDEEKTLDYVQVVAVEYAGEEPVYDLSVPDTEAFVGNGIVNHNTVNLPNGATPSDFREVLVHAWRSGVKAVAPYRDGSKGVQPVVTRKAQPAAEEAPPLGVETVMERIIASAKGAGPGRITVLQDPPEFSLLRPTRERLPDTRDARTHHFEIDGHDGYVIAGLYEDGRVGEVFVKLAKEGSTLSGFMDSLGISTSIGLQYGVPLEVYCRKFALTRFEPSGFTRNPDIRIAKSIVDYVFRWLGITFVPGFREEFGSEKPALEPVTAPQAEKAAGPEQYRVFRADAATDKGWSPGFLEAVGAEEVVVALKPPFAPQANGTPRPQSDCPPCRVCGAITFRQGPCYGCANCGSTSGCG